MKRQEIADNWKKLVVGQDHAIDRITPYIVRALAGLNAPGKPLGVFFLMGPTGTGKTLTPETLSEILHGTENNVLRIDCGEYQLEHEVAKLVGSPPGYLGHRETQPALSQLKVNAVSSDKCGFSIVLFDEIEKAHAALWRSLLGILDKATLRLGDNNSVSFEKTFIFLSSNIGAKEMAESLTPGFGFTSNLEKAVFSSDDLAAIEKIGKGAMKKKFPPEFPNRIDEVITYHPLEEDTLRTITELELRRLQTNLLATLGNRSFALHFEPEVIDWITKTGTSMAYGARELKRTINRSLLNPLADDIVDGRIVGGSRVDCYIDEDHIVWDVEQNAVVLEEMISATRTNEEIQQQQPTKKRRSKTAG